MRKRLTCTGSNFCGNRLRIDDASSKIKLGGDGAMPPPQFCCIAHRIFKVRAAGFLPGVLLFSDLSFEKFSPGFYFFPKSKNSFAGSYFFLNFHTLFAVFYRFQCIWRQKRSKKFACGARGLIVSQNFPPPAGSYYFPKSTKKIASRGFIFSENSQNLPSGVLRRGGF